MAEKFVHFDGYPPLVRAGSSAELPRPYVYVLSRKILKEKVVALAAKRFVDMMYVTGLDYDTALEHFRPLEAGLFHGLYDNHDHSHMVDAINNAWSRKEISIKHDDATQSIEVTWNDPELGALVGRAVAYDGYGGVPLGSHSEVKFTPAPIKRQPADRASKWPLGDEVPGAAGDNSRLNAAVDRLFETSQGLYGLMVSTKDDIVLERYGPAGAADRVTPSWSMTKAITGTLIGRLVHKGWIRSVYDPAPAPLWTNPRDVRSTITLDDLLRMRSGLGFPCVYEDGNTDLIYENSFVYYHAENAFDVAQRAMVCTVPGSNYRYINTGINVMGAIVRDQIERRGLPYHETVYGLLADKIGMNSYQHSADIHGNFIGSGAGFATMRDYARFGLLYLQDGVWNGERLLPEGWVEYALTPTHTGSAYAACFRSNNDRIFPSIPSSVAWASGADNQKVIIMRDAGLVVTVTNERDHPVDLTALDKVLATCIEVAGSGS